MRTELKRKNTLSGSKMISMTIDEMRAACERGEDQTDWDRIRRMVRDNIEPAQDKDAPDASNLIQAEIDKRRRGRPFGSGKKVQVSIRYHHEVLDYFKSTGDGWQTRMDEVLHNWVKAQTRSR
jgi:uncharacterized protein (DUF4415 family)